MDRVFELYVADEGQKKATLLTLPASVYEMVDVLERLGTENIDSLYFEFEECYRCEFLVDVLESSITLPELNILAWRIAEMDNGYEAAVSLLGILSKRQRRWRADPSSPRDAVAGIPAMTSSTYNDTPAQPQPQTMGAARRGPRGSETLGRDRQGLVLYAAQAWGSSVEYRQVIEIRRSSWFQKLWGPLCLFAHSPYQQAFQWRSGRRPPCLCDQDGEEQEETVMSKKEMSNNITFIAALEMLAQLENQGLLTPAEVERTKTKLKRRLRPTLILV